MIESIWRAKPPKSYNAHEKVINLHYVVDMYECELGCLHSYVFAKYPSLDHLLSNEQKEYYKANPMKIPDSRKPSKLLGKYGVCPSTNADHLPSKMLRYSFPLGLLFPGVYECLGCKKPFTKAEASEFVEQKLRSMYGESA